MTLAELIRTIENADAPGLPEAEHFMRSLIPSSAGELASYVHQDPLKYHRAHVFKNDRVETTLPDLAAQSANSGPRAWADGWGGAGDFGSDVRTGFQSSGWKALETGSGIAQAGSIPPSPPGHVHQVGNGSTQEPLITLHLYSPPLGEPASRIFEPAQASQINMTRRAVM